MTGIDVAIELYQLLNGKVSARVWQHNRPRNSKLNDVVISVPEFNKGQLNSGYVDINVYSQNVPVTIANQQDTTFPNITTFKTLVDAIIPLLDSTTNFDLTPSIVGIPIRDNDGNWYVNIRVSFEGLSNESLDIELWSVNSTDDGFGGVITTKSLEAETKASRINIGNGTQLNINVGRYELNMRCDWVIPSSIYVAKNYHVHYNDEVYVINGISPKGKGFTQLSTVKCDDFYGGGVGELIINAMPAWADKPYIIDTTQW